MQYRISMLFLLVFLLLFLPLKSGKKTSIKTVIIVFFVTFGIDYYEIIIKDRMAISVVATLEEIIIVQGTAFFLSRYRDFRALFVGMTSSVYVAIGNMVSTAIYIYTRQFLAAILVQLLIHLSTVVLLSRNNRKEFLAYLQRSNLEWKGLCSIPALFYMILYTLSVWPVNIWDRPENVLPTFCVLLLIDVSYTFILQMFTRIKKGHEMELSLENLRIHAANLKNEMESLQEKEHEMAVIRHDLRHYMVLANAYLDQKDIEKLRQLFKQLDNRMKKTVRKQYCDNASVNAVIGQCEDEAKQHRVQFEAETQIPKNMRIDEFEFAVVVSNILENAIDAAAQLQEINQRFVKIKAHVVKEQIILEVSNTYVEDRMVLKDDGQLISQKGEGHGYGLQSVKAFIEKNEAIFDYSIEDGVFYTRILVSI